MDYKRSSYNKSKAELQKAYANLAEDEYIRMRKTTPRESFRLMGISDKDIDKMLESGVPEEQLYKQAGNSIVVDVLYHLFRKMLIETGPDKGQSEMLL